VQAWSRHLTFTGSPYRFYALSNVGSILGLLCYPTLIETHLSRHAQAVWWSVGFALFAVIIACYSFVVWKGAAAPDVAKAKAPSKKNRRESKGLDRPWLCFGLPTCASILLLAVTNKVCQDIAVVPFLWVLPLVLYLLSFVICFDHPRWYWRPFWVTAFVLAVAGIAWLMLGDSIIISDQPWLAPVAWALRKAQTLSMFVQIGLYLFLLFTSSVVCHGEVFRLRPPVTHLTAYYLLIAAGGACGGLFVAVIAPLVFRSYFEFHFGLLVALLLVAFAILGGRDLTLSRRARGYAWLLTGAALLAVCSTFYRDAQSTVQNSIELSRNFYGVIRVFESDSDDPKLRRISLQHGATLHGVQFLSPELRSEPTTYYTPDSGVGLVLKHFPRQSGLRVGIVGLGAGTLAAYGRAGDCFRFYEINDEVRRLAESRFTFLKDSAATVEIVMGDARLSLEHEKDQQFDVLVLDAFNSDSIPVHLLTREAFEVYRRHLKPDGVIAVHISNRSVDLEPVLMLVARHFGYAAARIDDSPENLVDDPAAVLAGSDSNWILLSSNEQFMTSKRIVEARTAPTEFSPHIRMWTDEDSSLLPLLRF
jgi:SAM-dependent methyltransferase